MSGRIVSARVVNHTETRLVLRATERTTREQVLVFKGEVPMLADLPLLRLWPALFKEGVALDRLTGQQAWTLSRLAQRRGLAVESEITDLGGTTFFDAEGRKVQVEPSRAEAVLQELKRAGCPIEWLEVD